MLIDGMTAANDLGLTDAVPARATVHTDTRRKSVKLDNLVVDFKQTAPSRLYWAGRPAMRVVQALHWLKGTLSSDLARVMTRLAKVLEVTVHGPAIRQDLIDGFGVLPGWMQGIVRELPGCDPQRKTAAPGKPGAGRARGGHRPVKQVAVAR